MKQLLRVFIIFLMAGLPTALSAQSEDTGWDSVYDERDIILSVSAGVAFPIAFTAYPGVEFILYQYKSRPDTIVQLQWIIMTKECCIDSR